MRQSGRDRKIPGKNRTEYLFRVYGILYDYMIKYIRNYLSETTANTPPRTAANNYINCRQE